MAATDQDLLRQYVGARSQEAFTELVQRHLPLVYSAALRQVRLPALAEEVSQTVFTKLAWAAAELTKDTVLTAWLYRVARHAAIDLVRHEARRQAREQLAVEMSNLNDPPDDWTHIEPVLEEAMDALPDDDRTAILLRYFENKPLREVGAVLGASEDAAQKRVARAVERLREHLAKRQVSIGAGALAALLSAHAVQAVPMAVASQVVASALAASASVAGAAVNGITQTIVMTTLQKSAVVGVMALALAVSLHQGIRASKLRQEVDVLRQQNQDQAALARQVKGLQRERDGLSNDLAEVSRELAALKKNPADVLKLRGEVGRLRRENETMGSSSPLSKVTANPDAVKLLRDQQKLGMGMIYRGFAKSAKLTDEQAQKLTDVLADHIMENVNQVTIALRDKPASEQLNQAFSAQDSALLEEVRTLLGEEGLSKYQDYTRRLLSTLSAEQFKGMLAGPDAGKEEKANRMVQMFQDSVQETMAANKLPDDYQVLPILNFRNIASEQEADRALKYLDDIYQRATGRLGTILTPDELAKFQEFRATAIKNSRAALALNRSMMAPIGQ